MSKGAILPVESSTSSRGQDARQAYCQASFASFFQKEKVGSFY